MNDGMDVTAGSDLPEDVKAPDVTDVNQTDAISAPIPVDKPAAQAPASVPASTTDPAPTTASTPIAAPIPDVSTPTAAPTSDPMPVSQAASLDAIPTMDVASADLNLSDQALADAMSVAPTVESIEPGSKLTGTVVAMADEDVFVELDAKSQGLLSRSQFGKKEKIEVGRRIDVVVDKFDNDAGLYVLFRKGAIQRATWTNLSVGAAVEGRVTGLIKGGLEIDLKGIRAFMPGSQADLIPMKDVSTLLNEVVQCEVVELDRRGKNVIVSRRKWMEKNRAAKREALLKELEVGQLHQGVVESLAEYGAFVDIGGVTGLAHISDLSWGNVNKVSEVLSVGQAIEVKVLKIDLDRNRISLGLKHTTPDPWTNVEERFGVGSSLKVRVAKLTDFGAFAELEPGVEGLIPISEMSWSRVNQSADVVKVGDMVDAVILRVEPKRRRIALSLKQAQADPWGEVLESFTVQSIVEGKITRLADFGAFLELTPGVEGLIHISELADKHVKTCSEIVNVGDTVKTRVLGVDKESRRISLSIRAVETPESASSKETDADQPIAKPKKKRKKPLRGGLSSHYDW